MKSKFYLGPLTAWANIEDALPGDQYILNLVGVEPKLRGEPPKPSYSSKGALVFECTKLDEDRAAVFELTEVR